MTLQPSKNHDSRPGDDEDPRITLLKHLVDPTRLHVVDRLAHAGPANVTRLATELGIPMPQLSNHLRRLRDAGLITGQRHGRQVTYALADPGLELLTPLLDSITGRIHPSPPKAKREVPSRTCYDHLAGPIGVRVYEALRNHQAVVSQADGTVELGPHAATLLPRLGIDPDLRPHGRQRFAFECLDATEHAPHLAGALGDELARSFTHHRWIEHDPSSRKYRLTTAGRRTLKSVLDLSPVAG